jgi:hypothetical protein
MAEQQGGGLVFSAGKACRERLEFSLFFVLRLKKTHYGSAVNKITQRTGKRIFF